MPRMEQIYLMITATHYWNAERKYRGKTSQTANNNFLKFTYNHVFTGTQRQQN